MRLCLVGADFEENLGIGMVAATAENAGHSVNVLAYNAATEMQSVARAVADQAPDVVGLSIQFQHRVHDFLGLAKRLRTLGYAGHITCGGQFPSLAWKETLEPDNGLDSIVLHEGERTLVDLLDALAAGRPVHEVPGLACRTDDGVPVRTAARGLVNDLDELPLPKRYRPHTRHMGIPFIPLMSSRGCWEACNYCSIVSFYKDARSYGGGKLIRHRSPANVADEMAMLWHRSGGAGIFCFHDDNFLLPRPRTSLERVRAIRAGLDQHGVGTIGIIGKSRPDCIDLELARELRKIGVLRLYIGVENASEKGADHLGRGTEADRANLALTACREAGIFVCYNLLIFERDAKLDHVGENIAFMRQHPHYPVNFCRAEPYFGTPLHHSLAAEQGLTGSYLGYDYRIADDRAELLFRICAAAFRQRNFAPDGIANRYMGLGYAAKVIEQFYPDPRGRVGYILERADDITRGISLETAGFLEEALELATSDRDADAIGRHTAALGLRIAEADGRWHSVLDDVYTEMATFGQPPPRRTPRLPGRLARLAQSVVLGTSLALGAANAGCGSTAAPAPKADLGVTDRGGGGHDTVTGHDGGVGQDVPVAMDVFVTDPLPPDLGFDASRDAGFDAGLDAIIGQDTPAQVDVFVTDPLPPDLGANPPDPGPNGAGHDPQSANDLFHWTDSSPRRATRSRDLPLYDPPTARFDVRRDGDRVHVILRGLREPVGTRWQAIGTVIGDGTEVDWIPESKQDLLSVALRTVAGVAILELRACDLDRTKGSLV